MLGQRFLPSSYQAKLYQMDYDGHKKRLNKINNTSKSMYEENNDQFRTTLSDLKTKNQKFQTSEKLLTIDKTNQVLLDKLVKISNNQKPALFKTISWSAHSGTLNTPFRKQQLEKIAQENEAMAKRLISQQGSVNKRQLQKDFEKHLDYSKNVQKINAAKIDKLLPIRSPKAQSPTKEFKVSKKKSSKQNSVSLHVQATRSEEVQTKNHFASPQIAEGTQENQANDAEGNQKLERTNSEQVHIPDDNDTTFVSKDLEKERKDENESVLVQEPQVEAKSEVKSETKPESKSEVKSESKAEVKAEVEAESKEAANNEHQAEQPAETLPKHEEKAAAVEVQPEAHTESVTEKKADENSEQKQDSEKSRDTVTHKKVDADQNKGERLSHNKKRSDTIQPNSNVESLRNSSRKGTAHNIEPKGENKQRDSAGEVSQVVTSRSNNNMANSQLKKSQLGKSQFEKSTVKAASKESHNDVADQSAKLGQSQVQNNNLNVVQSQVENVIHPDSEKKPSQQSSELADGHTAEKAPEQEVQGGIEHKEAEEKKEVAQQSEIKVEEQHQAQEKAQENNKEQSAADGQ